MTAKQRMTLLRILSAAALLILYGFLPAQGLLRFCLYLLPYLIIGYDVLIDAAIGIWNRQLLDEKFLMALATIGALILGVWESGDYTEAVAVMLFYQTGELFQSYAVGKSRRNIQSLMNIRPDHANIVVGNDLLSVDPQDVAVDSQIIILPGERIPIDGIVTEGYSSVNAAALTGESLPRDVAPGCAVLSGCINTSGRLTVQTTRPYSESTATKILQLMEEASSHKSHSERFVSRFARVYTPVVCACALALLLFPPVLALLLHRDPMWTQWLYRALSFLVASCPCALVISIPLSFFASIGGAGKAGILIKGSNYIEALAKADTFVFDKTGTLTKGALSLGEIASVSISQEQLLDLAAHADSASNHPISKALQQALGAPIDHRRVSQIKELPGRGMCAVVDGLQVAVGNQRLMKQLGIFIPAVHTSGTIVYVSINEHYAGHFQISDTLKPTAAETIEQLKQAAIRNIFMLTGDTHAAAQATAAALGIEQFYCALLPADKVSKVEQLLANQARGRTLAFVGDGMNDAPVLSRADVGIAMGAIGSDAAIDAADIVLMDDDPLKIITAIKICKKCLCIVRQNIGFAIGIKLLSLVLVAIGCAGMWLAVFADVGVMVLAILNAIRALDHKHL